MADKKVTQLTALTAPANNDLLLIVDDPSGSPVSKKITVEDLLGSTSQVTVDAVNLYGENGVTFTADTITLNSENSLVVANGMVINEGGGNFDTRIESDGSANALFVDASADSIGILCNDPTEALDVNSDAVRVRTAKTPPNSSAGWKAGTISWDSSYLYIAVSDSVIKRVSLSTF